MCFVIRSLLEHGGVCTKNDLSKPEGAQHKLAVSSGPRLWDYSRFDGPPRPHSACTTLRF